MHFCSFLYFRLSFGSVSRRNANLFNMVLTYSNFLFYYWNVSSLICLHVILQ